ncbi:endolytic transglycosylase MltG [Sneathiella glossodoripedis]|uniref:endolytic transglycosylase MltG n=1 Tax=Sneathiella glossodoripedis TaxID=418853 RepID=UPI000472ACD0|nr:endolytic transglycosylase MltG [Sneathiella glossodoripedis]
MKKYLIFLIALFLLFNAAVAGLFGYGWHLFTKPGPLTHSKIMLFEKGTGVRQIAKQLQSEGIIHNEFSFLLGTRLQSQDKSLKAGEYEFTPGMSGEEVMSKLVEGKSIQHALTIPEGLQSLEIRKLIEQSEILVGEITEKMPEGSILPETYHFNRGDSRDTLIRRMKAAFQDTVDELWQNRNPNPLIKTKNDLIILASIVEKETGVAGERAKVASVFLNRLRINMRLQSDPTVIYGVTKGLSVMERPISKKDLAAKNEYNTYTRSGLPAGPICNPGIESLKAVLSPAQTKYLYFVASGDGGHVFATNLADHNRNVRNWRKIERSRKSN